ncbi:class I SAM-dependent methyltransferase [Inquilinus sp. Marseille-Q2685]|uniref:class I SAM-dependent methyltransferase n=1 Tax=Inquilinus sp. Marseille-Q2685 TaxID=2866581 RepID=UPI001CE3D777|nr:class I SAM-dependent methyltransferase [Inquilinus sp. Marseille-Q2685]
MPYSRRAAVYDVEYTEERDVGFILGLVGQAAPSVLEVPCGAGRLSLRIAPYAGRLTVVDLEPEMVARTVAALEREGHGGRIRGRVADMRELRLEERFDLALIPREALQLLPPEEGRQALAAAAAHVAPGGRLAVDLATFLPVPGGAPDPDYYDPARTDGVWATDWIRTLSDGSQLVRQSAQHHDGMSIRFDLQYRVLQGGRVAEDWAAGMRLHRYSRGWIDDARPDGMAVEAVHGDYDGSDFTGDSPRLIALYRRGPAAGR